MVLNRKGSFIKDDAPAMAEESYENGEELLMGMGIV